MKILFILFPVFLLFACTIKEKADLIFVNGNVYTMDPLRPHTEAVAVLNGKFLYAGDNEHALSCKTSSTKVIDLHGQTVIPGLIESHGHFMQMGFNLMQLDLHGVPSYEELVARVKKAVSHAEPGEWILGMGWHQSKWSHIPGKTVYGFPTNKLLNEVSPDNPVFLFHASGHAALANAKAMEIAGITRNTKYTGDGEIIRDENGDPTGIFNEGAAGLIQKYVPEPGPKENLKAFRTAVNECLKNGITTFHDAGVSKETIPFYKSMLDSGEMKVRMYVMILGSDSALMDEYMNKGPEIGLGDNFLTVRAIKLFADGALGSRGAWLLEPYTDEPDQYGGPAEDSAFIYHIASRGIKHGFQVCTHAIGDRANREVLNIYQEVFSQNPDVKDPRFRVEHAQHLSPEDIPRFAEMGVIASMQTIHMSSDRPWAIDRLGEKRIKEGAYVWQKLLKSGARIVDGTDVPVEPINPIANFYAAVTRKTLKGTPEGGYEPEEKMTREQALRSYTLDAAYGEFDEHLKGSIEPGKLADLTILDKDIMKIPDDEILSTRVSMTIIGGKVVYRLVK